MNAPALNIVPFVSVHNMMRLVNAIGVERVLTEIGAQDVPRLLVFNKCDLLGPEREPRQAADTVEGPGGRAQARLWVSARSGQGLARLRSEIARCVDAAEPALAAGCPPHFDTIGPDAASRPD